MITIPELFKKGLSGQLFLKMYKHGELIMEENQSNLIVNNGLLVMAKLLAADFTNGEIDTLGFGDGNVAPTISDQDLEAVISAGNYNKIPTDATNTTTIGANQSKIYWEIVYDDDISGQDMGATNPWTPGDPFTITEFGLFAANGDMFNHIQWTGPDLVMDTGIKLEGFFLITIEHTA